MTAPPAENAAELYAGVVRRRTISTSHARALHSLPARHHGRVIRTAETTLKDGEILLVYIAVGIEISPVTTHRPMYARAGSAIPQNREIIGVHIPVPVEIAFNHRRATHRIDDRATNCVRALVHAVSDSIAV
jgi:hypothetical protein